MKTISKMWFAQSSASELENSIISETVLQNAACKLILVTSPVKENENLRGGLNSDNQEQQ